MHRMTTSDGLSLAYYVDDMTPPWTTPQTLVLLHAAMGNSERYFAWLPVLAQRYRVIRMDMRGHGNSDTPQSSDTLSMERLVMDVTELLDELNIESAHIAGSSAGGYIAQHLAIAHPRRVDSLMLYSSTAGLKNTRWEEWAETVEKRGLRDLFESGIALRLPIERMDPEHVEWFLDTLTQLDLGFIKRFVRLMSSSEWLDQLARIECPTLIVAPGGTAGNGITSLDQYRRMQELIPHAKLVVYEGLPHHISDAVPQRCVRDLIAFLENLPMR